MPRFGIVSFIVFAVLSMGFVIQSLNKELFSLKSHKVQAEFGILTCANLIPQEVYYYQPNKFTNSSTIEVETTGILRPEVIYSYDPSKCTVKGSGIFIELTLE